MIKDLDLAECVCARSVCVCVCLCVCVRAAWFGVCVAGMGMKYVSILTNKYIDSDHLYYIYLASFTIPDYLSPENQYLVS